MASKKTFGRVRNTTETRLRNENFKKLIYEFSKKDLTLLDICGILNFSLTGSRRYLRDLNAAGLIENNNANGKFVMSVNMQYSITKDQVTIEEFIKIIDQPCPENIAHNKENLFEKKRAKMELDGRHLHIMEDDVEFAVRVNKVTVRRDQLVAALFCDGTSKKHD